MTNTHSDLMWSDSLLNNIEEASEELGDEWNEFFSDLAELDELFGVSNTFHDDVMIMDEESDVRFMNQRKDRWLHIRLNWHSHVRKLEQENNFDWSKMRFQ